MPMLLMMMMVDNSGSDNDYGCSNDWWQLRWQHQIVVVLNDGSGDRTRTPTMTDGSSSGGDRDDWVPDRLGFLGCLSLFSLLFYPIFGQEDEIILNHPSVESWSSLYFWTEYFGAVSSPPFFTLIQLSERGPLGKFGVCWNQKPKMAATANFSNQDYVENILDFFTTTHN